MAEIEKHKNPDKYKMEKFQTPDKYKFHVHLSDWSISAKHGHKFIEFAYILRGGIEHTVNGQLYKAYEGDYFIVDHGIKHSYKKTSKEPLLIVNFLFYPEFIDRNLAGHRYFDDVLNSYMLKFRRKTLQSSPTGKTLHDESGHIRGIVEEIIKEYENKKHGFIEYIRCRFVEILILTMRKIGKKEHSHAQSDTIINIIKYLNENYGQSLRLSDTAKIFGYTPEHLSKKFSAETGMGFLNYLQRLRIEQSCCLLENSNDKISEIALAVGYDDVKYFNKLFKRTLGMTPREYRKLYY